MDGMDRMRLLSMSAVCVVVFMAAALLAACEQSPPGTEEVRRTEVDAVTSTLVPTAVSATLPTSTPLPVLTPHTYSNRNALSRADSDDRRDF